jgi:hypothetical protein
MGGEVRVKLIQPHARFHFAVRKGNFVHLQSEVPNAFLLDKHRFLLQSQFSAQSHPAD